jgi:hypothetical protein
MHGDEAKHRTKAYIQQQMLPGLQEKEQIRRPLKTQC